MGVDWEKTWQWMKNRDFKGCTEALIGSNQEQALRTYIIKFHIDNNTKSPECRICGEKGESANHRTSQCSIRSIASLFHLAVEGCKFYTSLG